ncbi:MbcA/ParS/Xre antitoxin family protein [Pseudomonas putida]|uniref:MbcA/ParS/Xre antitoxin family protein n=1 Tax=Pseudomonas putida TaxID=303 RepID=UPI0028C459AB|nr:MbcA/ParS/Xre antitoxin family protein [Pseudomonas putida]
MLSRDRSLPDNVRDQAKRLLRHYPTRQAVRLAGRCEAIRQDEISRLPIRPQTLHPALATWPLLEPFFCDLKERDTPEPNAPPASVTVPKLQPISGTEGVHLAVDLQILGLAHSIGVGCVSVEYRCFTSARATVLSRATVVLGSRARASTWFESPIQSLNRRKPCTLMGDALEFTEVMEVLICIEYGIYY